jgi:hypothetical protein
VSGCRFPFNPLEVSETPFFADVSFPSKTSGSFLRKSTLTVFATSKTNKMAQTKFASWAIDD